MTRPEKPLPEKPLPEKPLPEKPLPETPPPSMPWAATSSSPSEAATGTLREHDDQHLHHPIPISTSQARYRSFNVRRKPVVQLAPPEAARSASVAVTEQTTPASATFTDPTTDLAATTERDQATEAGEDTAGAGAEVDVALHSDHAEEDMASTAGPANHKAAFGTPGPHLPRRQRVEVRAASSRLPHPVGLGGTIFPPRGSSRAAVLDYTAPPSDRPTTVRRFIDPRLSREFRETEDGPGLIEVAGSISDLALDEPTKRTSHASKPSPKESPSKAKISLANLRGLFRKPSSEPKTKGKGKARVMAKETTKASPTTAEAAAPAAVAGAESAPNVVAPTEPTRADPIVMSSISPVSRSRVTPVKSLLPVPTNSSRASRSPTPASSSSPRIAPPSPGPFRETTDLAAELLLAAKREKNMARRDHLVEMGRVLVNVITQARQAEQAVERAKLAATQAEVASTISRKTVYEVEKMIREWKKEDDAKDDEAKEDDAKEDDVKE